MPLVSLFVLNLLKENRRMNAEAINQGLSLPEAKLRATLERLTEAGLIEAMGTGRGRNYVLSAKMYLDPAELLPLSRPPEFNREPLLVSFSCAAVALKRRKVDNRKRSGASGLEDRYAANYTMPTFAENRHQPFSFRPPC